MRTLLILLGKELRQIFLSPLAYVVLLLFMLLNGVTFYTSITALTKTDSQASIVSWMFRGGWFYLSFFPVFPLITMRLVAEERKMGTLETLLTAPVRTSQLVLSKYIASVIFYAVLWVPSVANFYIFQFISHGAADLPPGDMIGSYLIVFLMGLFYLAIGLFASALARNQIIAAILSLTMIVVHFLVLFFAVNLSGPRMADFADFFVQFAPSEHLSIFSSGLVDTRPIVYYLSLAGFFLALTHQVLEFRRWKT